MLANGVKIVDETAGCDQHPSPRLGETSFEKLLLKCSASAIARSFVLLENGTPWPVSHSISEALSSQNLRKVEAGTAEASCEILEHLFGGISEAPSLEVTSAGIDDTAAEASGTPRRDVNIVVGVESDILAGHAIR